MSWVTATVLLAAPAIAGRKYKGFARGESLIPVQELKNLMDAKDSKLVVLAVVEPVSHKAGHIPGSINVWRPDYELKVGEPYPFDGMQLERDGFQSFARGLGIDNDSKVVVYDEKYDATRLWWAFYLYGKTDVRVLDGGYGAWKAAGYEAATSLSRGKGEGTGTFMAKERRSGWVAGMDDVRRGQT
jgi:thiosulfate/3-mercaptopyruvate sulfurtransferase